jgi:hypothetical protein
VQYCAVLSFDCDDLAVTVAEQIGVADSSCDGVSCTAGLGV